MTPADFHRIYPPNHHEITTSRDLAVNIVETVFVLAEFTFWQVSATTSISSLSHVKLIFFTTALDLPVLCL
jgi:hypothetical protein